MPESEGGMGALPVPVRQFIGSKARNPCTHLHDTESEDMNELDSRNTTGQSELKLSGGTAYRMLSLRERC